MKIRVKTLAPSENPHESIRIVAYVPMRLAFPFKSNDVNSFASRGANCAHQLTKLTKKPVNKYIYSISI